MERVGRYFCSSKSSETVVYEVSLEPGSSTRERYCYNVRAYSMINNNRVTPRPPQNIDYLIFGVQKDMLIKVANCYAVIDGEETITPFEVGYDADTQIYGIKVQNGFRHRELYMIEDLFDGIQVCFCIEPAARIGAVPVAIKTAGSLILPSDISDENLQTVDGPVK